MAFELLPGAELGIGLVSIAEEVGASTFSAIDVRKDVRSDENVRVLESYKYLKTSRLARRVRIKLMCIVQLWV